MASKEYYVQRKQSPLEVFIIPNGTVATANLTSSTIDLSGKSLALGNLSFQVIAKGLNTADATVATQHSNDGKNWVTITDSTLTLASGDSTQTILMNSISFMFYRVVFTKTTNSAGSFQVTLKFT